MYQKGFNTPLIKEDEVSTLLWQWGILTQGFLCQVQMINIIGMELCGIMTNLWSFYFLRNDMKEVDEYMTA